MGDATSTKSENWLLNPVGAIYGTATSGVTGMFDGPDIPQQTPLTPPDPPVQAGSEGIRRGESSRIASTQKRYLRLKTRTSAADDSTLGALMQTLA